MENYFTTYALLGLQDSNLPVHRGTRQKRYESIEKMLDLIDVAKRIGPQFPSRVIQCDISDPEWDDDMTYLVVDYSMYQKYFIFASASLASMIYNYNVFFRNRTMSFVTKAFLAGLLVGSNLMIERYRKQVLRANLFDEYVQLRADELIKEKEKMLYDPDVTEYVWFSEDFRETMNHVHRQSWKNDKTDFADSELILQDFIRRYTDDTLENPLNEDNSIIM